MQKAEGGEESPSEAEGSFLEDAVLYQLCALLERTSLLHTPLDFFCKRSQRMGVVFPVSIVRKGRGKGKVKVKVNVWGDSIPEAAKERVEQIRKTQRGRFTGLKIGRTPPTVSLFSTVKCRTDDFGARISSPSDHFKARSWS